MGVKMLTSVQMSMLLVHVYNLKLYVSAFFFLIFSVVFFDIAWTIEKILRLR